MLKYIFVAIVIINFISSCSSNEKTESTDNSNLPEKSENSEQDIYTTDWLILKQAILDKNEAVVLTFVSNEDPILKEAINISYDYIFDEEIIEQIRNLDLKDLEEPGVCGTENTDDIIKFDNCFINLHKTITNDSTKTFTESSLEIELQKTKNGLKIINYKTFQQTYDIEGL